jgi:hypothetical protein
MSWSIWTQPSDTFGANSASEVHFVQSFPRPLIQNFQNFSAEQPVESGSHLA